MKNYNIIIGSPIEYEELTADIVINQNYVARVQKEEGNDKMIVEIFEDFFTTKIYLDVFLAALEDAKMILCK